MSSTSITSDEKLAQSVRNYSVLYDKSCTEFKEKLKKNLLDVAKEVGLTGSNSLCRRQVAILLPNYGNLLEVSFAERFLGLIHALVFLFCAVVFGAFVLSAKGQESGRKTPQALPLGVLGCSNARAYLIVLTSALDV